MAKQNLPAAPRGTGEAKALLACNRYTAPHGLMLSEQDARYLLAARERSLVRSGRVELGGGILPRLVYHFCDSPYIHPAQWAQTLCELQDIFYHAKTESCEAIDDEALLLAMKLWFDGECHGSLEYLVNTKLEALCRALRAGDRPTLPQEE